MVLRLFLVLLLAAGPLVAEPTDSEQAMHEISGSIMSPFCPGRLLRDCPSSSAIELRQTILERLQRGEKREDIEESLITVYGEAMRAAPRAEGFGIVAWVAPFALLLGGFLFVLVWLRAKRSVEEVSSPPTISDDMRERIEKLTK